MPSTRYRLNNLYRKTKSKNEKMLVLLKLAQVETDRHLKGYWMKSVILSILCLEQKKLPEKYKIIKWQVVHLKTY